MRVFSSQSRYVDGKPVVTSVNASLSIDELRYLDFLLSKTKPIENNAVAESVRSGLCLTLNEFRDVK